jgi:phage/plasmid-like protein (TIGR03299 family)
MSHEIRNNDNFGYVGQPAWHGLGIELPAGIGAEDGFRRLGIDWETELLPVYVEQPNSDEYQEVAGHRLHVRKDTRDELGMVTANYKPMQNMELARFADAIAGADAATMLETAGTLYGNRRVFALVKLPEVVKATAEDVSEQYVLLSNGHGGCASFSIYPTSVRVVCANTLRWSERDAARGLSFRHMGDFDSKLKAARKVLGIARKETEKFQEQVDALVRTQLDASAARAFIELCWDQAFGSPEKLEGEPKARMLARRNEQIQEILGLMENSRNSLPGISGTAWAALNAVTEFHDHHRGRFKPVAESKGRVNSNLFGQSAYAKTKALRAALALV